MTDAADPLSLYRNASRDLLHEVKPPSEPMAVRSLLREAARDLLGIRAEADDDEVRRRCLEILEAEKFFPGDDVGTAIRMLCAEPAPEYRLTETGPQYRQRVDRLVRRELEKVAARLRTEPGPAVREALAKLDPLAALSRTGRVWHARLVTLGDANLPMQLKSPEQQEIVRAIRAVETIWPGEATEVRRESLARLTPRDRFLRAARALEKRHPCITSFDQPLLEALQLVTPTGTTGPPLKPPLKTADRFFRYSVAMFLAALAIALVWPNDVPERPQRSAGPAPVTSTRPRGTASPGERVVPGVTDFPELPRPTPPAAPGGFQHWSRAVYAPHERPATDELIPGEVVTISGSKDESLYVDGPGRRERVLVPFEDLLYESSAKRELEARIARKPSDPLAHLALGNFLLQDGYPRTAEASFAVATALGLPTVRQRFRFNVVLHVPRPAKDGPEVPPPPPLPRLFPGAAP